MDISSLSDQEKKCIGILAACVIRGEYRLDRPTLGEHGLPVDYEEYVALMTMMENIGVIDHADNDRTEEGRFASIGIASNATVVARQIQHHEKEMQRELDILKWQEERKEADIRREDTRRAEDRAFQASQNELNRQEQARQNNFNREEQARQNKFNRRTSILAVALAAFLALVSSVIAYNIGLNKSEKSEPQPIIIQLPEAKPKQ